MKVLTITSLKGGVGKSVTAVHLATYFSDKHKVLLIDEDQNKTAIQWASKGLLPFTVCDANKAIKLIPSHDVIIRDKQARRDEDDLADLAEGSDLVIIPTTPDMLSLHPAIATSSSLGNCPYRMLITIVPPPPAPDGKLMQQDLETEGIPVFKTTIRRTIGFARAALEGVPIRDLKGQMRLGWLDYKNLGEEVEKLW